MIFAGSGKLCQKIFEIRVSNKISSYMTIVYEVYRHADYVDCADLLYIKHL